MSKDVTVCVCTECVMKGAMDLIESIESLKKLKNQMEFKHDLILGMDKCLGEPKHGAKSPLVSVDGELLEEANSEIVMEKIMALMKKDGN